MSHSVPVADELPLGSVVARHDHLTFRANADAGRHGWLRLTPAYGVRLVRERLAGLEPGAVVTDPFCGTGTTVLAAAEAGLVGRGLDINPFLLWFGNAKVASYPGPTLGRARHLAAQIVARARADEARADSPEPWVPPMRTIERWWTPGTLAALARIRAGIDDLASGPGLRAERDLLEVALCRTVISRSAAAFDHQSLSFRNAPGEPAGTLDLDLATSEFDAALASFTTETGAVLASAGAPLPGTAHVWEGDARDALPTLRAAGALRPADLLLTSPPYCNRMSYVRELRPYMYWTRHLTTGSEASELDWRAIGGTWGSATSRLNGWIPEVATPIDARIAAVGDLVRRDGGRNGPAMATYVHRYHHDMWLHLRAALGADGPGAVADGGRVCYVVGNSTFFGHEVPVHEWLALMLAELGLRDVGVDVLRKRSSKKALFEYAVTGRRA